MIAPRPRFAALLPPVPILAAVPALAAGPALAAAPQDSPAGSPESPAAEPRDALVFYSAGLDRILTDPRDAGLRAALGMLDDRLVELPGEMGASPMPGNAMRLAFDVLGQPMVLRAGVPADADWSMGPRISADLRVGGEPEHVASIARRFSRLMSKGAELPVEPVENSEGLEMSPTPMGPFVFGTSAGTHGTDFVASLGGLRAPAAIPSYGLPDGVDPLLAYELDMGPIQGVLQSFDPDPMVLAQLQFFGLFGEDAMRVTGAYGVANGTGHVASRVENALAAPTLGGLDPSDPLTAADLSLVPTDAVSASVVQADPNVVLSLLDLMSDDPDVDMAEMIYAFTGIHPRTDVFDHLGTTMGFYMSDTSGGGGLFSLVLFLEVTNEEAFAGTLEYVFAMVDDFVGLETDGRVDFRTWESRGVEGTSLTFPGWPIPVELCLTVSDGFLFFALSPQSLVAAVQQARSDDPGLLANEKFRTHVRGGLEGLNSVAFVDTARRIEEGWGFSTLLFAALANGVRSPADGTRDPGLIVPPYHELVGSALPTVMVGRVDGNDLVYTGTCDPSMTAQLSSFCGSPMMPLVGVGLGAGLVLPTLLMSQMMASEAVLLEAEIQAPPGELYEEPVEEPIEEPVEDPIREGDF